MYDDVYELSGDEDEEYRVQYIMEAMATGDDECADLAASAMKAASKANNPSTQRTIN